MTNFAYNTNIPDGPNNPSADQPKMKINTNSIASIIDVDHVGFGQNNGGEHKQVTFTANEAAPGLNGGVAVEFANVDANLPGTDSWPFWQNAAGSELMVGPSSNTQNGYLFLGALLIQWGWEPQAANGSHTLTFPTAFKAGGGNRWYTFTASFSYSGAAPGTDIIMTVKEPANSSTQLQYNIVTSSSSYTGFFWIAIGKRP